MIQPDGPEVFVNGNGASHHPDTDAQDPEPSHLFIKLPEVRFLELLNSHYLFDFLCSSESQTASYPTGSLDFLVKLRREQQQEEAMRQASSLINGERHSKLQLKIVIVGAGLGGLAAAIALLRKGHQVTVVEQAPSLGEVCFEPLFLSRPFPQH